jgi:glycosyltransferase involved in cell wall biosynthesis
LPSSLAFSRRLEAPVPVQGRRFLVVMISFIVPVKNGLPYTRALVESVRATNPEAAVEWVIVDSGSTDGTPEYLREIGARLVSCRSEPFNYCAALNAGAAVASGDLWIMSNNDVELRSPGSLRRLERAFCEWPVLGVLSPGRETGAAEIEFQLDWLYGPCWAVRPGAFRAWGGMPEAVSGYGYDELWTVFQCWRQGLALGYLTGWTVFHHGSVTFGATGGNTAAAMRRNLSRLLAVLDAADLDERPDPDPIISELCRRQRGLAPSRLAVSSGVDLGVQGYANAGSDGARVELTAGPGAVQWVPWLANELLLQPDAAAVGADGIYAVRDEAAFDAAKARAVGPPPPPLMPPMPMERTGLRERLAAALHNWRHRKAELPPEW